MFDKKTILITGGAGSFGSFFCKHLLSLNAKKIIIFSRGWLAQMELRNKLGNPDNHRWFIGDVRDRDRLIRATKDVDILIHAAAIKCLDACEYNPSEAMLTNVVGTQNVIDACIENGVKRCLLISTDKAVNPINSYGISKAYAEKLWINANKISANDDIRFSICRYGNVIGSAGSIIPIYKKLISDGVEKLPVTDERMTRYFFQMNEAIEFVTESIEKMQGNEIFTPKLKSVRIVDICKAFNMPYEIVGIKPGEKLHEQMDYNCNSNDNEFLTIDEIKKYCDIKE